MSMDDTTNKSVIWGWAAAAGVVAFIIFKFLADYRFGPAILLAVLVAILVAILIWLAFFRGQVGTASQSAPEAVEAKPAATPAAATKTSKPTTAADMMGDAGKSLKSQPDEDFDGDGVIEGTGEGAQPAGLSGPRAGGADDLKKIKGVGPKLEQLLNSMGFYHYDQIAGWSVDEVAWVNANLAGFKGRVTRDNWIEQAKTLAAGGDTAFSKKVDKGGVY